MRLRNKVALITGGTSGIGAATVQRLTAEGATVIFTGRNAAAGDAIERAASTSEAAAHFHAHEVDDRPGWETLEAFIRDRFGRLDIAFANAGIEGADTNIEEIELDAWDKVVAVNLTGPMLTARHAIRLMRGNPGGASGSIILNSSMNGILALGSNIAYSSTKGALRLLGKSIAMHCAKSGLAIRCNSIHPGVIETQMVADALAAAPDPVAARRKLEDLAPIRRMGTVEEVAGLIVYLASDEAAFVTGSEYGIDGGSTAGMEAI